MNSVALQILEQFNAAFIQFLNPATPQDQRNAIGGNRRLEWEIDQAFVDVEKQPDSWKIGLELMDWTFALLLGDTV